VLLFAEGKDVADRPENRNIRSSSVLLRVKEAAQSWSDAEMAALTARILFEIHQGGPENMQRAADLIATRLLPRTVSVQMRTFGTPQFTDHNGSASMASELLRLGNENYGRELGRNIAGLFAKNEITPSLIQTLLMKTLFMAIGAQSPTFENALMTLGDAGKKTVYDIAVIDDTMSRDDVEKIVETLAAVQKGQDPKKTHVELIATGAAVQGLIHRIEADKQIDVPDALDETVVSQQSLSLKNVQARLPATEAYTLNLIVDDENIRVDSAGSELSYNLIIARRIESLLRTMIISSREVDSIGKMAEYVAQFA
jgi:hypothetical protein